VSVLGLLGLPLVVQRGPRARASIGAQKAGDGADARVDSPLASAAASPLVDPLRPLLLFSILTFLISSLVFPVSTTWGTFLHASGAIHVLLVVSALLVLDRVIDRVGVLRAWSRPVAWLGPAFAIAGCLLFSAVLLAGDGRAARESDARFTALAAAFSGPAAVVDLASEPGPVITDVPIWFAEATRHHTLALPNESPQSILDLARSFDPPARLLVVDAANSGVWPAAILNGAPGSECFVPVELPDPPDHSGILDGTLVFRIRCP
jgi:hypothetical protein